MQYIRYGAVSSTLYNHSALKREQFLVIKQTSVAHATYSRRQASSLTQTRVQSSGHQKAPLDAVSLHSLWSGRRGCSWGDTGPQSRDQVGPQILQHLWCAGSQTVLCTHTGSQADQGRCMGQSMGDKETAPPVERQWTLAHSSHQLPEPSSWAGCVVSADSEAQDRAWDGWSRNEHFTTWDSYWHNPIPLVSSET